MTREKHDIVALALRAGTTVPAFNISYLPQMVPIVRALRDTGTAGMIAVARPDWVKFGAGSPAAVRDEYDRAGDGRYTWLHLDHVPVIDEDDQQVDYRSAIDEALELGYRSVMVDGSRLPLDDNIEATRAVVERAHARGVLVEAELGAVMGHEEGPLPPYEELFASGRGFTSPAEAKRFVKETGTDWLSVAVGNVHGAISASRKAERKVEARLSIERLEQLRAATGVPLVLHGGSGIRKEYVLRAIQTGIAKVNIATAVRQPYERSMGTSEEAAREATYRAAVEAIENDLEVAGSASVLAAGLQK